MMNVVVNKKDAMTPMEREKAIQSGADYDRIPIVPFIEQWKCGRYHVLTREIYQDPSVMAELEIKAYNEYGHDRMWIGPNSMGVAEALGANTVYPPDDIAYIQSAAINDTADLEKLEALNAFQSGTIERFRIAAEKLRVGREIRAEDRGERRW